MDFIERFLSFFSNTGFNAVTPQMVGMWGISFFLLYLAVKKGFEPLLLVPIAFGALIANLPTHGVITLKTQDAYTDVGFFDVAYEHKEDASATEQKITVTSVHGGLYDFIMQGIKLEIFPPLIFLGVGALTDFGPLIANPRVLLLGAAAQVGICVTFLFAVMAGFSPQQAASIGIIGGADGPTSIFVSNKLAPELLGSVAVAAYTYMALVPLIQPPIMRMLTSEDERKIRMKSLRKVSKVEKLIFALLVTVITILLVPDASPLIAMLMLGNFLRECGVTERLSQTAQNGIINVVTIFLGTSVGMTMQAERFLNQQTMVIIMLGIVAFGVATASGVIFAKLMNLFSPNNLINPLIGSAGVSAVPMAARVSEVEGLKADSNNHLLMHAMGPNVAGVIGTAVIAGYYLSTLK